MISNGTSLLLGQAAFNPNHFPSPMPESHRRLSSNSHAYTFDFPGQKTR
jgi:hypothetical protein